MINLKRPSGKTAQSFKVKTKTKVRTTRRNKESRPPKKLGKIRTKSLTELSKTITGKKIVLLFSELTLLP